MLSIFLNIVAPIFAKNSHSLSKNKCELVLKFWLLSLMVITGAKRGQGGEGATSEAWPPPYFGSLALPSFEAWSSFFSEDFLSIALCGISVEKSLIISLNTKMTDLNCCFLIVLDATDGFFGCRVSTGIYDETENSITNLHNYILLTMPSER